MPFNSGLSTNPVARTIVRFHVKPQVLHFEKCYKSVAVGSAHPLSAISTVVKTAFH